MSEKEMANITAEANEARLSTLAAEINTIKTQTQKIMMQAAVEIGRRLVEAKGAVGHGGWGAWLEHNVDYSERTAQNLIRIFQEYGEGQQRLFGESNPQAFADLTYTQAVALLGIKNPDERAEFVESHDVANMTSRELADAIKERDEARAALEEAEKESEDKQKNIDALQKTLEDKGRAAEKERQELQKTIDGLVKDLKEAQESAGGEPDEETKKRIETIEKEKAALEAKLKKAEKERDEAGKEKARIEKSENALLERLEEKNEKLIEMEAKVKELSNKSADPGKAAFSAYFNLSKNAFNGMLEAVGKIEDDQEKYRAAMVKMLEAMIETVKEAEE